MADSVRMLEWGYVDVPCVVYGAGHVSDARAEMWSCSHDILSGFKPNSNITFDDSKSDAFILWCIENNPWTLAAFRECNGFWMLGRVDNALCGIGFGMHSKTRTRACRIAMALSFAQCMEYESLKAYPCEFMSMVAQLKACLLYTSPSPRD